MSHIIDLEPTTYEDTSKHHVWKDSMIEEFQYFTKNDVWDIVPRPEGKSIVTSKWLFKIKHGAYGSMEKHKVKFIARGFSQKDEVDYDETFVLMAQYT